MLSRGGRAAARAPLPGRLCTADSVSAERGYLREAGNLVFHVSLLVRAGWGWRSASLLRLPRHQRGDGRPGLLQQPHPVRRHLRRRAAFTDTDLQPFSVTVKNFEVKFETGPVQRGAARLFRADVEVTDRPGAAPRAKTLEVNQPLHIGGTTVHLIGHGYAPEVTVKDGNGDVAFSGPVVFLPQDGNFTSAGVIKAPDAPAGTAGLRGLLPARPRYVDDAGPHSIFPDALEPGPAS